MTSANRNTLDRMYAAFADQDVEAAANTVTEDSIWIHHGTQKLTPMRFEGKPAVAKFFSINFTSMKVSEFVIRDTREDGEVIIVSGQERFTMDGTAGELVQKWVQVYTFRDGLIARMEEYATSALADDYTVIAE